MRIAKSLLSLSLVLSLVIFSGCIKRAGTNTPATPYEQVMVWNTMLAQTNNSVAKGLIALDQVSPPVISTLSIVAALRIQAKIADDDNKLTVILEAGPAAATGQADQIKALIADIQQQATLAIQDQSLGIKNPTSQQTISAELSAVAGLGQQLITQLKTAGILK